jgi:quinol monooxygenase YgiN
MLLGMVVKEVFGLLQNIEIYNNRGIIVISKQETGRRDKMVKIIVRNKIREGRKDEFLTLVKELVEESRKEEGNIAYGLWQDRSDPDILTFVEDWKDQAAIDAHNAAEHFKRIVPRMLELVDAEQREARHYMQVI